MNRISELLWVFVEVFQDPIWIAPGALLALGLSAGVGLAIWLTGRTDEGELDEEARRLDLEKRRDTVIEAIRALDLERDKLSPEDYEREKRALLGHGAAAMRALEESVEQDAQRQALIEAIEAQREALGGERTDAIRALLEGGEIPAADGTKPAAKDAPTPMISPVWQGALATIGVMGVLLAIYLTLNIVEATNSRPPAPEPGQQTAGTQRRFKP